MGAHCLPHRNRTVRRSLTRLRRSRVFIVLPKVLHVEVAVSTDLKLDKLNVQPDQFRLNVQPNQYKLRPGQLRLR